MLSLFIFGGLIVATVLLVLAVLRFPQFFLGFIVAAVCVASCRGAHAGELAEHSASPGWAVFAAWITTALVYIAWWAHFRSLKIKMQEQADTIAALKARALPDTVLRDIRVILIDQHNGFYDVAIRFNTWAYQNDFCSWMKRQVQAVRAGVPR